MTKIIQSKELTAFYNAYNDWLKSGAPEENDSSFNRNAGMCCQIRFFLENNLGMDRPAVRDVMKEMVRQFYEAGLALGFPFGMSNYNKRAMEKSQHLDPVRIAWVKAHLTEEVDKEFTLQ